MIGKMKVVILLTAILTGSVVYSEESKSVTESAVNTIVEEKQSTEVEKKEELVIKSNPNETKKENIFKLKLKQVYGFNNEQKSKLVPFVYYINEAGIMAGAFYFNTDTFNLGGKTTATMLYGPSTDIATLWADWKDFKVSEKIKLGGTLKLIKYNEIRNYWPGNDSPDNEADEDKLNEFKTLYYQVTHGLAPASDLSDYRAANYDDLRGYKKYHGFDNKLAFRVSYDLTKNTSLTFEPAYEVLKSQVHKYKSDSVTMGIMNKNMDDETNPRKGHKVSFNVKKSLNLIGKDDFNSWDFYKVIFDARKYFPVSENSTFAVRMKTETTGGKKVIDKERSLVEGKEVYSYAPFFDMAMLGDLEVMRGSYLYRYWGKNSMLIQTEYRFPILGSKSVQGTIFADIGRVSDEYKLKELFTDMNYNGGAGVRYYFNKDVLIRVDFGVSDEGFQIRSNLGQAF